jgi:hypothetical protein
MFQKRVMTISERFNFKPLITRDQFNELNEVLSYSKSNCFTELPEIFDSRSEYLIENSQKNFEEKGTGLYLIYNLKNNELIGIAGLVKKENMHEQCFYCNLNSIAAGSSDLQTTIHEIFQNTVMQSSQRSFFTSCHLDNHFAKEMIVQLGFREVLHVNYFSKPIIFYHWMLMN